MRDAWPRLRQNATGGSDVKRRHTAAFAAGLGVGSLGGLVGLGGAEFRLPILIAMFGFPPLEAVILNKAASLATVASALPFRAGTVPWSDLFHHKDAILSLLGGSLIGAWFGAGWATRIGAQMLYRVLSLLLIVMAGALVLGHGVAGGVPLLAPPGLWLAGAVAGFAIGVVAAIMGVAGGELLIPTFALLFGADLKLAGSLSLAVSLPTMVMAFARYSRDASFATLARNGRFVLALAAGSVAGAFVGGKLVGVVDESLLLPLLALVLIVSAIKVWRHA